MLSRGYVQCTYARCGLHVSLNGRYSSASSWTIHWKIVPASRTVRGRETKNHWAWKEMK